jgi:ATP-dependent DNA helicase RecG
MTKSTLKNLIALGEGFTTEFKRSDTSNLCREYGVAEPIIAVSEHWFTVTFPRPNVKSESENDPKTPPETQVTPEVQSMLSVLDGEISRRDIMRVLGLSDEKHFRENYQQAAVRWGLIEMTIPDKPRSRNQKYRLTARGRALLNSLKGG